jgi:hypothetical protein
MLFFGTPGSPGLKCARLRIRGIALIALLLCLTAASRDAYALPSNNVPLDDWSYAALDKLAGFGLIYSDVHGMRPYTRLEVARLVNEALNSKEEKKLELPPIIEQMLKRFEREFREELAVYGRGKETEPAALVLRPVQDAKVAYVYSDGKPRDFLNTNTVTQYPQGGGNIVAYEGTPLLHNNEGVVYGKGNNVSFQFSSSFQLWDVFSGYVEPIAIERENATPGRPTGGTPSTVGSLDNSDLYLLKGYVKFSPFDSLEVEFGRDAMWWGQGYNGTLILTDNAAPLDMLKVSNPTPSILPGFLGYLGPFRYTLFCAQLETDRDFPNTKYGGSRVDFKPTPNFEIGMSHTFQFGGTGSLSSGSFLSYLELVSMKKFGGSVNSAENHEAAFDFRYRMPYLWNAEFYGEWGGEDTGFTPNNVRRFFLEDIGYILGLYFPKVTADGLTDLRFEYADNVNEGPIGSHVNGLWYAHGLYISGMTYNGLILGDPMGPDARDFFVRATRYLTCHIKAGLDFEYSQTGRNVGRSEESIFEGGADLTWELNTAVSAMARYAYGEVLNLDLVQGENQTDNLFMLEVKYKFF